MTWYDPAALAAAATELPGREFLQTIIDGRLPPPPIANLFGAGLRSASQLERICHPSLWDVVANRIQRAGGPPVSVASVLRIQVQELKPGLVDVVAVIRRGQRATFIALRLEAVPGRWELIELLY